MTIDYDGRHLVNVLTEDRCGIDGKRCAGLEAEKRLDRVIIKVGNLSAWRCKHGCGYMPAFKLSLNYDAAI